MWWVIGVLLCTGVGSVSSECAVGDGSFYEYISYYDDLEFYWELNPGSSPTHCSSVTVCIDPPHYPCYDETGASWGYVFFDLLQSGQPYTANLTAIDVNTDLVTSQFTTGTTVPFPPSDLNIAGVTPNSVTLEIVAPCCNTVYDYYLIWYKIPNGPWLDQNATNDGNVTYHTVDSLQPATLYQFAVFPVSNGVRGKGRDIYAITEPLVTVAGDTWIHPGARYYKDSGSSSHHGLSGVRLAYLLSLVYWCLI